MKIGFTNNPDFYKFSDKHFIEITFFKYGWIFSLTNFNMKIVDRYNVKTDEIEEALGYMRISKIYKFNNKFPYIREDSIITQTILPTS